MATKKKAKPRKKPSALAAKSLSAKKAKGIKGGAGVHFKY